jgi:hypothetical protein
MRMDTPDLQSMLSRMPAVRQICDLDLLLFFCRHPRALLTGERIVAVVGYDRDQIERSLDRLIDARLLTCSQVASRAARLYVLQWGAVPGGLISNFLEIATTRQGRRELMRLLRTAGNGAAGDPHRASVTKIA